jgi:hypothetical protein
LLNRLCSSCLTLLAVALSLGCASMSMRRETRLGGQLELAVDYPRQPLRFGAGLATFRLTNKSERPASGCLTRSRSCIVHALEDGKYKGRYVVPGLISDHAACVQRFNLAPSETFEWQERFLLEDFPAGKARFSCSVEVTSGKNCHRLYGCYTAHASIPAESIMISAEE